MGAVDIMHDTDTVEGALIMLFVGFFFSVAPPPPLEIFLPTPLDKCIRISTDKSKFHKF